MKILAKVLLCALLAKNVAFAIADDATAKASADAAIKQMSTYQEEASKLGAAVVFAELERLHTLLAIKQQSSNSFFVLDEDTNKAAGYAAALQARRKTGDPAAPMATSNSPTCGHPKFPQARRLDYEGSGVMARRAAASLSR